MFGPFTIFKQKPKLAREAFEAYFHRLPEQIQVKWMRDGKFIVGKVQAGDYEFTTQGEGSDDFVEMVNDAILTVYDIPKEYFDVLLHTHAYYPPAYQMEELRRKDVSSSQLSIVKNEQALKVA